MCEQNFSKFVLKFVTGSGKWINLSHGSYVPSGQVSFNTLTFGVQTSTAFAPTFRAESLNLVTPTDKGYVYQACP